MLSRVSVVRSRPRTRMVHRTVRVAAPTCRSRYGTTRRAPQIPSTSPLEVECIDRMYLNVYAPKLQFVEGVVSFLRSNRGQPQPPSGR